MQIYASTNLLYYTILYILICKPKYFFFIQFLFIKINKKQIHFMFDETNKQEENISELDENNDHDSESE